MEFYHNLITEKSFKFLQALRKDYDFILIGGWAVFLYAHSLKSKDIDIIIGYETLGKIKEKYEIFKNGHLKKYEIKLEEIDVDIYLPHYSDLGIEINKIEERTAKREGFIVPEMEILMLLKLYAWQSRIGSIKGQKDEIDIFGLALLEDFSWQNYSKSVAELNFGRYHHEFIKLLKSTKEVKELNLNAQRMSKVRKEILAQLAMS